MLYEDLTEYISKVYPVYPVPSAEEYIKQSNTKEFCPVIDTPAAMFLKMTLEIKKPLNVLELGTSIGYSSTIIASTIKRWNGQVVSVDNDEAIVEIAKKNYMEYNDQEKKYRRITMFL